MIGMQKSILWAEAIGKLRAMVAVEGSQYGTIRGADGKHKFERMEDLFNKFILEVEDEEYHR